MHRPKEKSCKAKKDVYKKRTLAEQRKVWDDYLEKFDKEMDEIQKKNRLPKYFYLFDNKNYDNYDSLAAIFDLPHSQNVYRDPNISSLDTIEEVIIEKTVAPVKIEVLYEPDAQRESTLSSLDKVGSSFLVKKGSSYRGSSYRDVSLEPRKSKRVSVKEIPYKLLEVEEVSAMSETETESKEEDKNDPWDMMVNADELDISKRERFAKYMRNDRKNQKLISRFIDLPPKKAAVWRTARTSDTNLSEDFAELSLQEKAQHIGDMVASRFIRWLRGLGGRPSELNEKELKEMFQIGMVNPASNSIKSNTIERSSLPSKLASAVFKSDRSTQHNLRRHIDWNVKMERMPQKTYAFNRHLPETLRFVPPKNDTRRKWLECTTISREVESFSVAFADILHLRSLEEYCKYLRHHAMIKKPRYLIESGAFDRSRFKNKLQMSQRMSWSNPIVPPSANSSAYALHSPLSKT